MAEPGIEEELPEPRRVLPGGPRLHRALLAAVLALVLAAAGLRLSAGGRHHAPVALPSSSAPVLPAPPTTTQAPAVPAAVELPYCPQADDGESACTTSLSVPAGFVAAVRALLPAVRTQQAVTETLRTTSPEDVGGLWAIVYVGRLGNATLQITVQREPLPGGEWTVVGGTGGYQVLTARHDVRGYHVDVQAAVLPPGPLPPQPLLDKLARDARLVAG
jgi:hypothetical protein